MDGSDECFERLFAELKHLAEKLTTVSEESREYRRSMENRVDSIRQDVADHQHSVDDKFEKIETKFDERLDEIEKIARSLKSERDKIVSGLIVLGAIGTALWFFIADHVKAFVDGLIAGR